jgi:hypothetical protein
MKHMIKTTSSPFSQVVYVVNACMFDFIDFPLGIINYEKLGHHDG